jgi:hypothetical protein
VKSVDSPVSAAARIQLDLIPRPAKIVHPERIDFGPLASGDSKLQEIRIENRGGLPFALTPRVNPPWRIHGPTPEQLHPGEEIFLKVAFEPMGIASYNDRLILDEINGHFIFLSGSGTKALEWPSQGLKITESERISGRVKIPFSNPTEVERTIVFEWPDNILAPRLVQIPSGETLEVDVAVDPEAPASFEFQGEVPFHSGRFSSAFPLIVRPAPAQLKLEPHNTLDLGTIAIGETASGNFSVTNTGGLAARLRFVVPSELSIRPGPERALVAPGENASFQVSILPKQTGDYSYPLDIHAGEILLGRLNVRVSARAAFQETDLPGSEPLSKPTPLPEKLECHLLEIGPHSFALIWKLPPGRFPVQHVETRSIKRKPDGGFEEKWTPLGRARLELRDGVGIARLNKLPAGSLWTLRIRIDPDGDWPGALSDSLAIRTLPLPPISFPWWVWGLGIAALAGMLRLAWPLLKNLRERLRSSQ